MAASGGTALLLAAALGPLAASVFSSSSAGSPGEPRSRMRVLSGSNWSLVLQGQWMVELWVTAIRPPGVGVVWHRGGSAFRSGRGVWPRLGSVRPSPARSRGGLWPPAGCRGLGADLGAPPASPLFPRPLRSPLGGLELTGALCAGLWGLLKGPFLRVWSRTGATLGSACRAARVGRAFAEIRVS